MITISSQTYRDQNIVDKKINNKDFTVTVFTINDEYRMIVDGHHALEAAQQEDIEPEWIETEIDTYRQELESMNLSEFLEIHMIDCNYYNVDDDTEVYFD
jgi:hypothetical protein